VLRNLNGEFRARELSAIMGPSGGGKSSLLNVLSGYNREQFSGTVKVNGSPRDLKQFRYVSSYVMQDSLLHPHLTVNEAMKFSVNLKIGKHVDVNDKQRRVSFLRKKLSSETQLFPHFTSKKN
jgi:ATP-binding cassette, subfamily G (WHITE), member 1